MILRNTSKHYGWISIALHWVAAVLIVGLFGLGLWMTDLSYTHSWYYRAPDIHQSMGVMLIALVAFRLVWRWANSVPAFEPQLQWWERIAARSAHRVMYLLMIVVLLSGYLILTADGSWISVFGWFSTPPVELGLEHQEYRAGWVHYWSAWALIAIAAVHTMAALKHHFYNRDRTLKKILGARD